ncbi:MAG: pantetheine-phosphate adenylyltransferase [Clostridia bacterium]|nr:pantetheine-phosphate adenylyltransferase [Clostridia bacterium]
MNNQTKATVALLPGSYDPITVGHMDVIRRAAALFDRVYVAVMTNDMRAYVADAKVKQYMFSMEERTELARLACAEFSNVQVVSSSGRLIDLVDEVGADIIIKGVRNEADYAYEQQHALYNRAHNPRAETLYLPADPAYDHISSTLVRQCIEAGQSIEPLVPAAVAARIGQMGK